MVRSLDQSLLFAAWKHVRSEFGLSSNVDHVITVYFWGKSAAMNNIPHYINFLKNSNGTAYWLSPLRTIIVFVARSSSLLNALIHELSHAAINITWRGSGLPFCLEEGYACQIEDRFGLRKSDSNLRWAKSIITQIENPKELFSFKELCKITTKGYHSLPLRKSTIFYCQCILLAVFLEQNINNDNLGLWQKIRNNIIYKSKMNYATFAQICKYDVHEFENAFFHYCVNIDQ
ncbi:MAG: hypothetical protein HJJLKODD_01365 [Phycisphaerae bacterium]|nr:hypothetical protein [Phycisphaerae bacterium]